MQPRKVYRPFPRLARWKVAIASSAGALDDAFSSDSLSDGEDVSAWKQSRRHDETRVGPALLIDSILHVRFISRVLVCGDILDEVNSRHAFVKLVPRSRNSKAVLAADLVTHVFTDESCNPSHLLVVDSVPHHRKLV